MAIRFEWAFSAGLLLTLAACASRAGDVRAEADDVRGRLSEMVLPATADLRTTTASDTDWWQALNDPVLDNFVTYAAAESISLAQATARVKDARASLRAARASGLPQIGISAASEDTERGNETFEIGLDLNWALDVFGQTRQGTSAARARVEAAEASSDDVRRLIIASVVSTYLNLRAAQAEQASVLQSQQRLGETLKRVERLSSAGYATQLDVERSRRQFHDLGARAADIEARIVANRNALSLLLDEPPGTLQLDAAALAAHLPLPAIPAPDARDLLEARPDLRAASAELDAAAADTRAARRALYPDAAISARGFETDLGRAPFDLAGIETELVARLAAPLIFRGRQLAAIDSADARLQAAALSYEQALLNALSEVDTALAQTLAYRAGLAQAASASQAARTALAQSMRLFDAGEIGFLDVLFAEEALLEADRAERSAERNAVLAWARYMSAMDTP